LCIDHFRYAFAFEEEALSNALEFLVTVTIQKMDALGNDLTQFIDKHSLGRSQELLTVGERTSWVRALQWIGSHDEYMIPGYTDVVDREGNPWDKQMDLLLHGDAHLAETLIKKGNV
jgi:hypothetical protein